MLREALQDWMARATLGGAGWDGVGRSWSELVGVGRNWSELVGVGWDQKRIGNGSERDLKGIGKGWYLIETGFDWDGMG